MTAAEYFMEKGIKKGWQEGWQEGKKNEALEIAKKLLVKRLELVFVQEATGLSEKELKALC